MNKLGFAIKSASGGAGNLFECNSDAWTNKVVDIREYQKLFNGLNGSGKFITFLSFEENGCFLVQLRTIAGRTNDFLSGWIYIPNEIKVTGDEIVKAHEYVRQILGMSSISEKQDEINAYFSKEFSIKEAFSKNVPSRGEKFGYRELGHFSMKEILDSDIYQHYYDGYKAIFLLEKDSVSISDEYTAYFTDFTNRELEKYCILMPPTKETLRPFGSDAQIVDKKGYFFDSPLRIKLGEYVQLYARRKGFEDIRIPQIEISNGITNFPLYHAIDWKKRIDASMFRVVNHDGEVIRNVTITVRGMNITNSDTELSEIDARKAYVKISANGYEDFSETRNVLNAPIEIVMHRKEKSKDYTIRMSNDKPAKMTLSSKYLGDEIPLVGYTYDMEGRNTLVPSSWFIWKQRLIGFAMCIITLFLIGGLYALDTWIDNHEFSLSWPPIKEKSVPTNKGGNDSDDTSSNNKETDATIVAVVAYLDDNAIWHKDSLDHYEVTNGLFEALNGFDFSKVKEYSEKISSKNLLRIINTVEDSKNRDLNLKVGKEANNGKYNKASDKGINIDNYIYWISQDHEEAYEQSASEPKSESKIKGESEIDRKGQGTDSYIKKSDHPTKSEKQKSKRGGEPE